MRARLEALAGKYDVIGDVRGRGAMLAVELVEPGTKNPDPVLTAEISGIAPALTTASASACISANRALT